MLGIAINPPEEAALMAGMAVLQEKRFQSVQAMYKALYGGQTAVPATPQPPVPQHIHRHMPQPAPQSVYQNAYKKRNVAIILASSIGGVCLLTLAIVLAVLAPWPSNTGGRGNTDGNLGAISEGPFTEQQATPSPPPTSPSPIAPLRPSPTPREVPTPTPAVTQGAANFTIHNNTDVSFQVYVRKPGNTDWEEFPNAIEPGAYCYLDFMSDWNIHSWYLKLEFSDGKTFEWTDPFDFGSISNLYITLTNDGGTANARWE
jgi:hypothetical protein